MEKSASDGIPEGITQSQNKQKGEVGIRTTGRKKDMLVNIPCVPVRFLSRLKSRVSSHQIMKIKISKHNLPVVEKIVDSYHSGTRSILYASGVGTGKSYVFMGVVERMLQELKNILYVIPKYAVQENISGYTDFQWLRSQIPVDFVTFNFFTDIKKVLKNCPDTTLS